MGRRLEHRQKKSGAAAAWLPRKIEDLASVNGILFILLSTLIIVFFMYHADGLFSYKTDAPTSRTYIQLKGGNVFSETIQDVPDGVRAVGIRFGTYGRVNEGTLIVRLKDGSSEIKKWEIDTSKLADNSFQVFELGRTYYPPKGSPLTLELKDEYELGTKNHIAVFISGDGSVSSEDGVTEGSFVKQWTLVSQEQAKKYKPLYFCLALAAAVLIAAFTDFRGIKWYKLVLIAAGVLFLIQFIDYDLFENINSRVFFQSWQKGGAKTEIQASGEREFSFAVKHSPFDAIEFFMDEKPEKLYAVVKHSEKTAPVYSGLIENCFDDGRTSKYGAIIDPEEPFDPGQYTVTLVNQGENAVQVYVTEDGELNGYIWQRTFIAHGLFAAAAFILISAGIVVWCLGVKRFSVSKLFLAMVIPLSLVYLIMFAPWSQPDTGSHFKAAYRYSNLILGKDENSGRQEDVEYFKYISGKDQNPSLKSYSGVLSNLYFRCRKSEIVDFPISGKMDAYSIFNYLPEVLGFSLGRLLNLSTIVCVYLGRLFILAAYIAICWYAVVRTPLGKGIIALIALLPMSLMMASAISYDPLVIAASLAFISSILYLRSNGDSTRGVIEACVWIILLGAVKGGGYAVLLPLVLLLWNKERFHIRNTLLIAAAGIASLVLFDVLLPGGDYTQLGAEGTGKLSAMLALRQPLRYLNMSMEAYITDADMLTINTAGTHLAWLEPTVPSVVVMALYILGGAYALFERDEAQLKKSDIFVMLAVVAAGVIGVPAMLLSWTKLDSRAVAGLQGRYYLPFVPLVLMAITKWWRPEFDGRSGEGQPKIAVLWGWFFAVSMIAVYCFVRIYLAR